ncbi:polyphosphate kinase 2 [Wenxinia marina]|uniref:ADP/GDP-polyphosphate phosphotransferase n=1 Tax=Wenxinia marina DSM 24838 TaxID=1123501 RepID=A0A0D0P7R7_9RHOB|nr:polyphosphate kinase 2 [Wenxinia marina]KIQ67621.1 polyphosphate kinase 2 family [Wenxinia marina DSM 24838]GGL80177.1 polyphosphate kinase 2 [Wenxinia marina]
MTDPGALPFDGAITRYLESEAPDEVRRAIAESGKGDVANDRFPYPTRMKKSKYEDEMDALQIELVKMQAWVKATGARILLVFEGRDAAGKGGTIQRLTENLNPRGARVVALPKPTEAERGQWYFQRYVAQFPTAGEIVLFDRSWYNRGVVEHVFGFCTPQEREDWFNQVGPFEKLLVEEGVHFRKFWLNVGRATQLERFLDRESDPLKQWKLSQVDVDGLRKWDAYTAAIGETLSRTHSETAPWTVVRGDDKRRSRLAVIRSVLAGLDYTGKRADVVGAPDPKLVGGPDLWAG